MDLTTGLYEALQAMATPEFLLVFLLGCANGVVFGVLPGLSGSVGIALMIPFTYGMGATQAMALFVAALSGQTFAGSVSAILLNTPGTSPNAATTFDGYPLARQGRGGFAIGISATSSFLGSLVGVVVLIALFPLMRSIILSFSFPEFTMLGVLGLAAIAVASRGSMLKGLLSGLMGLLVSFVGFSPIGGDLRYVFGLGELYDGVSVVAVLIGLFAVTEAIRLLVGNEKVARDVDALRFGRRQVWEGVRYVVVRPLLVLRSALLGTGIGIVPGVGGTLASFLAYFQAANTVKDPRFGRGDPRGVLAPEAANDAKDAGAALPTLAFGIPGSADWAIILGAMVIHGVQPGPNLIRENPDVIWVAIFVILAASLVSSTLGVLFAPRMIQVTRLRPSLLAPVVVVLAVTGAFALEQRPLHVLYAVGFGLLGYAMRLASMPVIPLILGLILGPMVERSFLQTLSTFDGVGAFVTRPLSLTLVLLTVAILVHEIVSTRRARSAKTPEERADEVRSATRPVSLALVACLGLAAVVAMTLSTTFGDQSRLFPLLTSALTVAVAAGYLLVACVPSLRRRVGGVIAEGGGLEQMPAPVSGVEEDRDDEGHERPRPAEPVTGGGGTAEPSALATVERVHDERRTLRLTIVLLVALALGIGAVGLVFTVPVALVAFFRYVGGETWRTTAYVSAGAVAFLYAVFVLILGLPIEGGLLVSF